MDGTAPHPTHLGGRADGVLSSFRQHHPEALLQLTDNLEWRCVKPVEMSSDVLGPAMSAVLLDSFDIFDRMRPMAILDPVVSMCAAS